MEKKNMNIVLRIARRINSNLALALPSYSLYFLIVFYLITDKSRWSWTYVTMSLSLGIFSALFFRFVIYGEGYDRKKRLKILIWIFIGVVLISAVVEVIIRGSIINQN